MEVKPPASLRGIQPYLMVHKQFLKRDPVVSYYALLYAVKEGIAACKSDPDGKAFLITQMDRLEEMKKLLAAEEALSSDVVAQAHVEEVGLKLFELADQEDRSARFHKNMIKAFFTSTHVFSILRYFGDLSEEIDSKQKYAKWKAVEIDRCLKSGVTPTPGPPGDGGMGGQFIEGSVPPSGDEKLHPSSKPTPKPRQQIPQPSAAAPGSQPQPPYHLSGVPGSQPQPPYHLSGVPGSQPQPPYSPTGVPGSQPQPPYPPAGLPGSQPQPPYHLSGVPGSQSQPPYPPAGVPGTEPPYPPASVPGSQPYPIPSGGSSEIEEETSGVHLSPEDVSQAQKLCKFASSALEYEDVTGAVDYLSQALQLLKGSQQS